MGTQLCGKPYAPYLNWLHIFVLLLLSKFDQNLASWVFHLL